MFPELPENIELRLNRVVRARFGLILSVRGATDPRIPLEALKAQEPLNKNTTNNPPNNRMLYLIFAFLGSECIIVDIILYRQC